MSAKLLTGKEPAHKLLESLKPAITKLDPKLVIVQVGDDAASASYIKQKLNMCDSVGLRHEHHHIDVNVKLEELLDLIDQLNVNEDVTGFIVQLPLPKHLDPFVPQIIRAIDPKKDVDGFTAYNLGKTFLSTEFEHLPPAAPAGVIELLRFYDFPIEGQHAVVVGRSKIVGKPLAIMLLNRGATVTVCHSQTDDLAKYTFQADILSAVGKAKLIKADMVKERAVVIDIGISRDEEELHGDVDFEAVKKIASAITPVPGGVGPMTVASLIKNCVTAKERQMERH